MRLLSPNDSIRIAPSPTLAASFGLSWLFAVHFRDQPPQPRGSRCVERVDPPSKSELADRPYLIDCDFGLTAGAWCFDATAPARMELRRERTHDDRVQMTIHLVSTHDNDRSAFRDRPVAGRVRFSDVDRVALDGNRHHFSSGSRPSATVTSHSLQSSRLRAISLNVSPQESCSSGLPRRRSPSSRGSRASVSFIA
jgi:hypothetical protein